MSREYTFHSQEEKITMIKRNLAGETAEELERETGVTHQQIHKWTKQYLAEGEEALKPKRRPDNSLSKCERKKTLTREEKLEYEIELLKRELFIRISLLRSNLLSAF